MSEQQFGWNYFENEVVIGDRQDKKRMIVIVFSNFMCIPYNRKAFDELVDWLNEQQSTICKLQEEMKLLKPVNIEQYEQIVQLQEENEQLRQQLKEKEEDERLYANEIVKLNKEAKEVLDFKSLGGDY